MKKVLCLLLATSMALMVAGCSGESDTAKDANTTAATAPDMRVYELSAIWRVAPCCFATPILGKAIVPRTKVPGAFCVFCRGAHIHSKVVFRI